MKDDCIADLRFVNLSVPEMCVSLGASVAGYFTIKVIYW